MAFVYLPKDKTRHIWIMVYRRNGRRIVESSGTTSEREARKLANARETDAGRGVPVGPGVGKLTLKQGVDLVFADYAVKDQDATGVEYRYRLHLEPYFKADTKMIAIDNLDPFIMTRKKAGASNGEINRELAVLRRAFRLAIRKKMLAFMPYFPECDETKSVRKGFFEEAQFRAVCRHLPADLQGLARAAYITGWRVNSELLTREWRHVDFAHPDEGLKLDPGEAKNDEPRTFPLTAELYQVLQHQWTLAETCRANGHLCPWVFFRLISTARGGAATGAPKRPKPIKSWRGAWRKACRAAGVPGKLPHDLRRTAVRNSRRALVSRDVGKKIHGMKTDSIYTRYDIVDPGDMKDAREKLTGLGGPADLPSAKERGKA